MRWREPTRVKMCRYIGEPMFPTVLLSVQAFSDGRLRFRVRYDPQVEAWLRVVTYSGDPVYIELDTMPGIGQWHIPDVEVNDGGYTWGGRRGTITFDARYLAPIGSPVLRRA